MAGRLFFAFFYLPCGGIFCTFIFPIRSSSSRRFKFASTKAGNLSLRGACDFGIEVEILNYWRGEQCGKLELGEGGAVV